jgi:glycosyltransferase involved in cell wall biosynthesis
MRAEAGRLQGIPAASEGAIAGPLVLVPPAGESCGVGDFTSGLARALSACGPAEGLALGRGHGSLARIAGAVLRHRSVVCNVPLVAWKRVAARPLAALALARLSGRSAVVCLHEWAGLHPLRRALYRPWLALASTVVVFSPHIRRELEADPFVGHLARRAVLAPLPPSLARPERTRETDLARRLAGARREGRLVLGCFGSIYPGKQPEEVLRIAHALKSRGRDTLLVYCGSFVRGIDRAEESFWLAVERLGLKDDVIVTGYVADSEELFGLFDQIDAFAYVLPEGMTSRRSSILACAQARPTVVTAPADPDEFAHHPRFGSLLAEGDVTFVPRGAPPEAYADAIEAALRHPAGTARLDPSDWWRDTLAAIRPAL